jgi:hypothetical protein
MAALSVLARLRCWRARLLLLLSEGIHNALGEVYRREKEVTEPGQGLSPKKIGSECPKE